MNKKNNKTKQKVIVSLTSFPAAIPYAVQVIDRMLKQSVMPDKIVLYLTASQFPGGIVPEELEKMKSNIFEIRFYEQNIRSYTKLIPALIDFPNDIIITVDDDSYYHKDMIKRLLRCHKRFPKAVVAHRAKIIKFDSPYAEWKIFKRLRYLTKGLFPRFLNLQTGVAGVLYPPNSLDSEMLDPCLFMEIAPTTDDIWLWAAAVSKGTKIVPVLFGLRKVPELNKPEEITLRNYNVYSGIDVNCIAFDKILEKYPHILKKIEN
jgi:hypothetical protein